MKLHHFLRPELVVLSLEPDGVESTLRTLIQPLVAEGLIADEDPVLNALLDREAVQSTGIGGGLAIPHAICHELESPLIVLGLCEHGVDFHALDEEPVRAFFLLLSPPAHSRTHIKLLARIARLMRQPDFPEELLSAPTAEDAVARIRAVDEQHP